MSTIVAGHQGPELYEGRAVDLPDAEPDLGDLIAIEAGLDDLVDEHLATLDVQVARCGHVDELAVRRHRRTVRAVLRDTEIVEVAA